MLSGVAGNLDICKYFTYSSPFLSGSFLKMTSWRGWYFLKRVYRNQIKSPACHLYALEIYIRKERELELSLGNVLQNDPTAIQQDSNVLHITNDAAAAPAAEQTTFHSLYVVYSRFSTAPGLKIRRIVIIIFAKFEICSTLKKKNYKKKSARKC